jgi:hypothetical protein
VVCYGGVTRSYPVEKLYEEMAFIAYYMHWSHEEVMNLEHAERIRWCEQISKINKNLNSDSEKKNIFDVY